MTALEKLQTKQNDGFHICVGLDSDLSKIPPHLKKSSAPLFAFNKTIIEATRDIAAAYKINLAFYEKEGKKGIGALEETLNLLPADTLIIGDAKKGDIGNTSRMYASSLFEHFKFDASTLHPYMGYDSVQPFLDYKDKLNFMLVLTSNPGNKDFEKIKTEDGKFLYQVILNKVNDWNDSKNCGIVFGATNPGELKENLNFFKDLPVLLPGVGSQGGNLEEVTEIFESAGNTNYLVNVSRALIYADSSENFGRKTSEKLTEMNKTVKRIISNYK